MHTTLLTKPCPPVQEVQQQDLLDQLQQSITGPGWEPADWDWRPTWLHAFQRLLLQPLTPQQHPLATTPTSHIAAGAAHLKPHQAEELTQVYRAAGLVGATGSEADKEEQQQTQELLAAYLQLLVDLEGPRKGLALAQDKDLLGWYQASLAAAVEQVLHSSSAACNCGDAPHMQGPVPMDQRTSTSTSGSSSSSSGTSSSTASRGCRVLVVSQGPGAVLGLLAAAAGASHVTVLSGGRCSHLADQQLLQDNQEVQGEVCRRVELVPCSLDRCWGPAPGEGVVQSSATTLSTDEVPTAANGGAGGSALGTPATTSPSEAAPEAGSSGAGGEHGGWVPDKEVYRVAAPADVVVVDVFDHRWVRGLVLRCADLMSSLLTFHCRSVGSSSCCCGQSKWHHHIILERQLKRKAAGSHGHHMPRPSVLQQWIALIPTSIGTHDQWSADAALCTASVVLQLPVTHPPSHSAATAAPGTAVRHSHLHPRGSHTLPGTPTSSSTPPGPV
jgi:hypothetical protein